MICNNFRIASLLLIAATAGTANAFVWTFDDPIDGLQEVPSNNSPAIGVAKGTYDDVTNFFVMDVNFSGLVAPETDAHIHKGARGVAGGVVFPLQLGSPKHFEVTFSDQNETDFLSGLYYVNIHSQTFPRGEIRGQLNPVPEPTTMVALVGAITALIARRRRS